MKYETTYKAPENLKDLPLEQLLTAWENTEYLNTPETPIVRGWLMDEMERRNRRGFNAWLDQDGPEDKNLRRYMTVNSICLNCAMLYSNGCAGTQEQVWTGCVYRRVRGAAK